MRSRAPWGLVLRADLVVAVVAGCGSGSQTSSSAQSGDGGGSSSSGASSGSSSGSGSSGGAGSSGTGGSSGGAGSSSGSMSGSGSGSGGTDGGPLGGVTFTIDLSKGPARQFQPPAKPERRLSVRLRHQPVRRVGEHHEVGRACAGAADSFTAWNWTNNFSNSGSDFCFWQGNEGGGSGLAGAIDRHRVPERPHRREQRHRVSRDRADPRSRVVVGRHEQRLVGVEPAVPGHRLRAAPATANGYAANVANLDFASTDPSSTAFVANKAAKGSAFCTCAPGGHVQLRVRRERDRRRLRGRVRELHEGHVRLRSGARSSSRSTTSRTTGRARTRSCGPTRATPGCGTSGTVTVRRRSCRATRPSPRPSRPRGRPRRSSVRSWRRTASSTAATTSDPNLPTTFTDYYLEQDGGGVGERGQAAARRVRHPLLHVGRLDGPVRAGSPHVLGPELQGLHGVGDRQHRLRLVGAEQLLRHRPLSAPDDPAPARQDRDAPTRARARRRRASRSASTTRAARR